LDIVFGNGDGIIMSFYITKIINAFTFIIYSILILNGTYKVFLIKFKKKSLDDYGFFKKLIFNTLTYLIIFLIFFLPIEYFYSFKKNNYLNDLNDKGEKNSKYNFFKSKYPDDKSNITSFFPGDYYFKKNKDNYTEKFSINKFGYRDFNYNPEKNIDVVLYGDSFTFGANINQGYTFSDILHRLNPNLNIANFAYNAGFTSPHYLLHYNMNNFSPSKIFIFIYLGNDCYSDLNETIIISKKEGGYHKRIIENGKLISDRAEFPKYVKYLMNNSNLFFMFFKSIYYSRHGSYFFNEIARANITNPKNIDIGEDKSVCYETLEYIKEIELSAIKRNANTEIISFLIPQNFFVYKNLKLNHTLLSKQERITAYESLHFIENVLNNCDSLDLNCVSLVELFRDNIENTYIDGDAHWNEEGHRLMANYLQKKYF